jgi:hypothetical protein
MFRKKYLFAYENPVLFIIVDFTIVRDNTDTSDFVDVTILKTQKCLIRKCIHY